MAGKHLTSDNPQRSLDEESDEMKECAPLYVVAAALAAVMALTHWVAAEGWATQESAEPRSARGLNGHLLLKMRAQMTSRWPAGPA